MRDTQCIQIRPHDLAGLVNAVGVCVGSSGHVQRDIGIRDSRRDRIDSRRVKRIDNLLGIGIRDRRSIRDDESD